MAVRVVNRSFRRGLNLYFVLQNMRGGKRGRMGGISPLEGAVICNRCTGAAGDQVAMLIMGCICGAM